MTVEDEIKAILIDEVSILEDRTFNRLERKLLAVVNADREARNKQLQFFADWLKEREYFYHEAQDDYEPEDSTALNFHGKEIAFQQVQKKFEELKP